MKTALTIIRSIGILGAVWIIYMSVSVHLQIHEQTQDLMLSSYNTVHPATAHLLQTTIPFALLAILLVLPYKRMNWAFGISGGIIIALLSAYFMIQLYGQYFLAARFVPEAIPSHIWISASIFVIFFSSQIVAILLQKKNVEQGAAANRCPPVC